MLASQIPVKFPLKFGQNASASFIRQVPTPSQIGIQAGAASLNDGFPPVTFLPVTGGGTPPDGRDVNGIINQLSAWAQWQAAGGLGATPFDASFASSIGGYPAGAVVSATGVIGYFWINLVDGNTSNPDAGGANWVSFNVRGTATTGDVKFSLKNVADSGWILMNDGSIGDASSGATTLASAVTQPLFNVIYNVITDTWAPLQTSGGGATTRAAQGTPAAAYAAHCRIVLPKALGRALAVAGAGSGLTSRALGQNLGEETHQLTIPEMPSHTHSVGIPNGANDASGVGPSPQAPGFYTTGSTGGDQPHNNMQPSTFLTCMVAL